MAPSRAERASQADLAAAFQYGDDHRVGHSDAADEQRDGAETDEKTGERLVCGVLRGEGIGGTGHGDLVRCLRADGASETGAHRVHGRIR